MIKEDKWLQYGQPRTEEGLVIVLHNTSNYDMSAKQLFDYLENECTTSQGTHFLVDSEEVIEVMPIDYMVYHTGVAFDYGNVHGIAIEIVSERDTDKYLLGQAKAIELVKQLQQEYGLTNDDVYFHKDFNPYINCPANILEIYGTKQNFIDKELGL